MIERIFDKLFVKQWNIAIGQMQLHDFMKKRLINTKLKWYHYSRLNEFYADPFVLKNPNGNYHIIYEKMCKFKGYGEIHIKTINKNFEILSKKKLLEFPNHLSYPCVYSEQSNTYIIPESSEDGNLYMYEFDFEKIILKNKILLISNMKLLDTTVLKYNNKYWLFSTQRGADSNSKLIIHYSDCLKGPYHSHKQNPFKNSLFGCRPAGNIFKFLDSNYRPTQNCTDYYGGSIVINKINVLNENEFSEEHVFEIKPEQISNNIKGIHTINFIDNVFVIDGLRKIFSPFDQLKFKFYKYSKFLLY